MRRGRNIHDNGETAGAADARLAAAKKAVAKLEPRERAALVRFVEGYPLVGIAGELGVSLEDAARLKASLMKKLGANVTADLVRIGIRAQVGEDP